MKPAPLPLPIAWPLAQLYGAIIGSRNRRFDRGRGVIRFDRPVISVGNLSVGGTGKTPMVMHLVGVLLEAGHRPVIAMRGYGAPEGLGGESDEAAAYRRAFPDVPLVAQPNRILGLIQQFSREYEADGPHSDCIVLDDGFQHRQIARDLNVVLVDATRDPFADRLLPAGWLREPVRSLARADRVILMHAESVAGADLTALDRRIAEIRGRGAEAMARHEWTGLTVLEPDRGEVEQPVSWLAGRRAVAVCGIGNPAPFLEQARRATRSRIEAAAQIVLRDHDVYHPRTIRRLLDTARDSQAQAIITTEKDWSKLTRVRPEAWPCPVARPRLELIFDPPSGGEALAADAVRTVEAGAAE